jgi:hypothetical protein
MEHTMTVDGNIRGMTFIGLLEDVNNELLPVKQTLEMIKDGLDSRLDSGT